MYILAFLAHEIPMAKKEDILFSSFYVSLVSPNFNTI